MTSWGDLQSMKMNVCGSRSHWAAGARDCAVDRCVHRVRCCRWHRLLNLIGQDENQFIARSDPDVGRLSAIFCLETKARLAIRIDHFVVVEFDLQNPIFATKVCWLNYDAARHRP